MKNDFDFLKMNRTFYNICSPYYILIDLHKIDLSKYFVYPNTFRMKFSVSDHCDILQVAEGKKLVHQVVSHCSSNKASLNRQLVLSGLFLVSAGLSTVVRRCDEISNL